jgi:hypothetical protein
MLDVSFFVNSFLLGVGLAMDAFSVSLANGLNEPCMKKKKLFTIAGVFAFFQALMPMLGWVLVHNLLQAFGVLEGVPVMSYGIPAVLSCYFDLFSGFVQAYVFSLLTMVYIAGSLPAPEEKTEE